MNKSFNFNIMKNEYQKGDKVRLVSKPNSDWPQTGEMDHFLDSEQIIEDVDNEWYPHPRVYFEAEITHEYYWKADDIDCKISDEVEFQQGETVLVWDNFPNEKRSRIFISKISCVEADYPFVVIDSSAAVSSWKNCEKVPPPSLLELIIEEIAEKFGVKPEQIKLK